VAASTASSCIETLFNGDNPLMKTTLVALLALAAAGSTLAQSNVTVFGVIDLNVTVAKAGGQRVTSLAPNGVSPSRLGFRGSEDLGGGLTAGFWMETQVAADTGTQAGNGFWSRRSTVSITSRTLGELRLGRDYTPTFWNHTQFSPFTTNGVGGSVNLVKGWPNGLGAARTAGRTSNSVGYLLPRDLGGLYGQAIVSAGEGADGNKMHGARLGYAEGPVNVAVAYASTDANGGKYKAWAVGGTYDFGVLQLFGNYFEHKLLAQKQRVVLLGVAVPLAGGHVRASFIDADQSGRGVEGDDARQWALGYTYALSKRTLLYTAYAQIRNKGNAAFDTADQPSGVAGMRSSGVQAGVNHVF
jgi:predicted porin